MQAHLFIEMKEKKPPLSVRSVQSVKALPPTLNDLREGMPVAYLNSSSLTGQVQIPSRNEAIAAHFKRLQFGQVYSVNQMLQGILSNIGSQCWHAFSPNLSDLREGKSNRHSTHQQKTNEFRVLQRLETATIQFNQFQCCIVSDIKIRVLCE